MFPTEELTEIASVASSVPIDGYDSSCYHSSKDVLDFLVGVTMVNTTVIPATDNFTEALAAFLSAQTSSSFNSTTSSGGSTSSLRSLLAAAPPPPVNSTSTSSFNETLLLNVVASSTDFIGSVTTLEASFDGLIDALNTASFLLVVMLLAVAGHLALLQFWGRRFPSMTLPAVLSFPNLELKMLLVMFPPNCLAFGSLLGAVANSDNFNNDDQRNVLFVICALIMLVFFSGIMSFTLYAIFVLEGTVHSLGISYVMYRKQKWHDDSTRTMSNGNNDYVFEPLTYLFCMGRSRIQGEWQSVAYSTSNSEEGDDGVQEDKLAVETGTEADDGNEKGASTDIDNLRRRLVSVKVGWYITCALLFKRRSLLVRSDSTATVKVNGEQRRARECLVEMRRSKSSKVAPEPERGEDEHGRSCATHLEKACSDKDALIIGRGIREIPVDAYHRFNATFQDVRGDVNGEHSVVRHYIFFRILLIGVPNIIVAALGTSIASTSTSAYYNAVAVTQPCAQLMGHIGHIAFLVSFVPLRDRLVVLAYTATAVCQVLAAIVKVGITVAEVRGASDSLYKLTLHIAADSKGVLGSLTPTINGYNPTST